jgi:hypothetical protein
VEAAVAVAVAVAAADPAGFAELAAEGRWTGFAESTVADETFFAGSSQAAAPSTRAETKTRLRRDIRFSCRCGTGASYHRTLARS